MNLYEIIKNVKILTSKNIKKKDFYNNIDKIIEKVNLFTDTNKNDSKTIEFAKSIAKDLKKFKERDKGIEIDNNIGLLIQCVERDIIKSDPDNENNIFVYRSADESSNIYSEGWYSVSILNAAIELADDIEGQNLLKISVLGKDGVQIEELDFSNSINSITHSDNKLDDGHLLGIYTNEKVNAVIDTELVNSIYKNELLKRIEPKISHIDKKLISNLKLSIEYFCEDGIECPILSIDDKYSCNILLTTKELDCIRAQVFNL